MKVLRYGMAIALIAVVALSVAGCSKEPLAAKVNGKKITLAEVDVRLTQMVGQQAEMFQGEQGEQAKVQFRNQVLDQMIEMELLMVEVNKRGIKVTDKEIDAKLKELMKDYGLKEQAELEAALKQQNMTLVQFKKELADRIQIEKLGDQVTKDVKASSKEVKEYYEKNKASFAVKDQVQVAHILVQDEAKAKKILADVQAGADFSKLAKEHSIDPGSKDKGGEMPMTDKDQFVPEFAAASWTLEPGQISDIVKTTYGFHIIKMIAKKDGGEKAFNDIKDEVEEQMLSPKKQEVFGKWLDELKAKAKIDRYLDANPPQVAPGAAPGAVPGAAPGAVPPADQGAPQNTVPQAGK
ncbi:MAG: hypothetical protein A2074_03850 [Candidatus Aquicultor primus]|uniref:peptidylprolyl isomerase n=1 Tax=Candidatus Aquicultor primus TaxID=1797195 RepID=A0A1F2US28_9ACTN|nr:MAG: hypothetical protein A2074_03850 [Candidatus Aquicultor primus]HCG98411.1 hypothetical protein [Actinomycetota bacterium]